MNSNKVNWKSPATGLYGNVVRAIFLSLLLFAISLSWLAWLSTWERQDDAPIVKLYVASSVVEVIEAAVADFNQHQHAKLTIARVGGSGELAGQVLLEHKLGVTNGADLLITADSGYLKPLVEQGVFDQQIDLAQQQLVVAVAKDSLDTERWTSPLSVDQLVNQQPNGNSLRLGITIESAAAGRLTRQAAKREGITKQQLEHAAVLQTENVIALGQALALGQLDVAIVWESVVVGINNKQPKRELAIAGYLDAGSGGKVTCSIIEKQNQSDVVAVFVDGLQQSTVLSQQWKAAGFKPNVEATQ